MLKLCQSTYDPPSLSNEAVVHGRTHEAMASRKLEAVIQKPTAKCGLFACPELPYLGASPDAQVHGNSCIVEVKSPYNGRDEMVVPGQNFAFLDENKALKKMSDYYFQIQGQLEITKAERCLFVVSTNKDLYVEEIGRDQTFFQRLMLQKLYEFYYHHYIKYMVSQL